MNWSGSDRSACQFSVCAVLLQTVSAPFQTTFSRRAAAFTDVRSHLCSAFLTFLAFGICSFILCPVRSLQCLFSHFLEHFFRNLCNTFFSFYFLQNLLFTFQMRQNFFWRFPLDRLWSSDHAAHKRLNRSWGRLNRSWVTSSTDYLYVPPSLFPHSQPFKT